MDLDNFITELAGDLGFKKYAMERRRRREARDRTNLDIRKRFIENPNWKEEVLPKKVEIQKEYADSVQKTGSQIRRVDTKRNRSERRHPFEDMVALEIVTGELEGLTIGQIASEKNFFKLRTEWDKVQRKERKYMPKQIINDIIEQDYFKVPKNSSEDPDIVLKNGEMVELKVSHLFKSNGLVRPKYRLVLKVLNYLDMAENSDWRDSGLYKKMSRMLIVFYYKDDEKPPWDWIVVSSFLWYSDKYNDEIQNDYTLTRSKVLNGEKISESDTNLLANCPKHNSKFCWWCHVNEECKNTKKKIPPPHPVLEGSLRPHPILGKAEKRGYCIPAQRMAVIFSDYLGIEIERRKKSYGVPYEKISILHQGASSRP